ncbi:hypothetical protein STCU_04813 [Strigomonas culicis]|nr:hypothetical protein STCU_04813 [Strigomonas culicis]|eukprot:EPY28924.1 hypothetical protein STCU_04813 [Strigomonas culicis]
MVETLLRFSQVRYTRRDAPLAGLQLDVPVGDDVSAAEESGGAKKGFQSHAGLPSCVACLGTSFEAESTDLKPVVACVEALATKCLFPAFLFLTYFEPSIYNGFISKSVAPKVATLWESVRGTYRANVLQANVYYYAGEPVTSVPVESLSFVAERKVQQVLHDAEKALKALEYFHVTHARADETFILGTRRPCVADAYAYAAASSFMHADFSKSSLASFQKKMREECPSLLKYVERLRVMFFDEYSGTYNLKPLTNVTDAAAGASKLDELYRKGRFSTLVWTAAFATVYFLIANIDMLSFDLGEDSEEKAEGSSAAAASTPPKEAAESQAN